MARNDDCDGIVAVGQSHGACGAGRTDLFGDFSIRPGVPVRNCQQRLPHPLLEFGTAQIQLDIEVVESLPAEIARSW